VVIRGESGVGKELVAQAIVQSGDRYDKPYVCLNCSALPETLIESELFGYERGAFTGADSAKPGLIELAHTGTLFLDEITTLDLGLQSKLLRAVQERSVQRLGGRAAKKIDFRLITATNDDLEGEVKKGRFREDLYYRINVVPIVVPPLRERRGDIAMLVEHFLRLHCTANKRPVKQLQPEIMSILEDYSWPGNVRELENIIQRLIIMSDGPVPDGAQHCNTSGPVIGGVACCARCFYLYGRERQAVQGLKLIVTFPLNLRTAAEKRDELRESPHRRPPFRCLRNPTSPSTKRRDVSRW
jgi:transcriptional regulator with PAS, ATPase and Fis domain